MYFQYNILRLYHESISSFLFAISFADVIKTLVFLSCHKRMTNLAK